MGCRRARGRVDRGRGAGRAVGFKAPIVAGLWILAMGLVGLSLARPDGSFAADVLPASLTDGFSVAFLGAAAIAAAGGLIALLTLRRPQAAPPVPR